MSQICSANIIIDLDIKLTYSIPNSNNFPCVSGCNLTWTPATYWMSIRNPLGQSTAFMLTINTIEDNVKIKEAPNGIPGTGIVRPEYECGSYGFTEWGYLEFRECEAQGDLLAEILFSRQGNILTVRLVPYQAGLEFLRSDPLPPNQAMTIQAGPIHFSSDEADTADRNKATTQKYTATSISPNPFSQSLKVQSNASETETISLQLLNSNGQTLQTASYKGGQEAYEFFTADVPPGFYFLQVKVADSVRSYRVVKIE